MTQQYQKMTRSNRDAVTAVQGIVPSLGHIYKGQERVGFALMVGPSPPASDRHPHRPNYCRFRSPDSCDRLGTDSRQRLDAT